MKELCIVPSFERPDFLAICLEGIRGVYPDSDIHVFPDRGTSHLDICAEFKATQHLTIQHTYHGNSFNMLEALKWASTQSCGLLFVIEDDAIVDKTFFEWCRAALRMHPEAFAACGWRYSPQAIIQDGPDLMMPWYLSVCAAIPSKSLPGIIHHARPEYYSNMQEYLDRFYPTSPRRGGMHYEQDGLVLRVCESQGKRCVWPRRPRATHIGFTGYHAVGSPLTGSVEERRKIIRLCLDNPSVLSQLMNGGPSPSIGACFKCKEPLLITDEAKAICIKCFHHDHPDFEQTATSHYYVNQ